MSYLLLIFIGLLGGTAAKLALPGRDPGGIMTIIGIGIGGALAAGVVGRLSGWYHEEELAGIIASVAGAIIPLAIYRVMARRGRME